MKNWKDYLYLVTIIFFTLGLFNIVFAWLGFICLVFPFILLFKNKQKTWCQSYCPRASLFTTLFKRHSLKNRPAPKWIMSGEFKKYVLIYFIFNLFILTMSTFMVFLQRMPVMDMVRFMIAFRVPWEMPQYIQLGQFPTWAIHLSFRVYSMMFTSTIFGLILGWFYKPRTWCAICPINTLSDLALDKMNKK